MDEKLCAIHNVTTVSETSARKIRVSRESEERKIVGDSASNRHVRLSRKKKKSRAPNNPISPSEPEGRDTVVRGELPLRQQLCVAYIDAALQ